MQQYDPGFITGPLLSKEIQDQYMKIFEKGTEDLFKFKRAEEAEKTLKEVVQLTNDFLDIKREVLENMSIENLKMLRHICMKHQCWKVSTLLKEAIELKEEENENK